MTVLASVDVEVTAKLNPMEQALAGAKREVQTFEKESTAAVNAVAQAANKSSDQVAKSANVAAVAQATLADRFKGVSEEAKRLGLSEGGLAIHQARLAKEADAAAKALAREAAEAKKLQAAAAPAADSVEKLAEANDNLVDASKDLDKGLGGIDRGLTRMGGNLGTAIGQIARGQSPVAALSSAAESGGGALLRMGAGAAIAGASVALVTGAVVAGGIAWNQYEEASAKAALSLYGAGAAAGLTRGEFEQIAQTATAAGGITINAARDMESAFIQAGVANRDILADLIVVTKDYAAVTGQEAVAAAQELGAAFAGDEQAIAQVMDRLGGLDDKTREHIQSLLRQNDLVGAQNALLRALQGEVRGAAGEVTGLAAAWRSVATWATNAFAAMGKQISLQTGGGSTGERLDYLRGQRDREQNSPLGRALPGLTTNRRRDEEIARLEATNAQEQATARATAAQRERNRVDREAREAVNALLPGDRQRAAIDAQIADINRGVTNGTIDRATATRALAAAELQRNAIARREAGPKGPKAPSNAREQQLAREAESMRVNAESSLALADAYMESAEAAVVAEARRTALTSATRRGIDVEAQAQRQLAINIGQAAAAGAKTLSGMREEVSARRAVNDSVVSGSQSIREATEWLEIDRAQRQLQTLALVAEGEVREQLLRIIDEQGRAVEALNREEARSQVIQMTANLRDQNEVAALELTLIGKTNDERRRAIALLQTEQRLRNMGIGADTPEGQQLIGATTAGLDIDAQGELATFMDRATKSTQAQVLAMQQDAQALNMTTREAERFRYENELLAQAQASGIELTDAQKTAIGQLADAYAAASEKLRLLKEHQDAVRDATSFATDQFSSFFDEIIFGSGSAEDAMRSLLKSVGQAMLSGFLNGSGPLAGILGTQGQNGQQGGAFGSIFGSIFGSLFKAPVAHSGLEPGGQAASSRMVSPALFLNAPRLHDGLKAGEFPAILEQGERVVPKNRAKGGDGTVVYMTVQASDADSFKRSDRQIGRSLKRRLSI